MRALTTTEHRPSARMPGEILSSSVRHPAASDVDGANVGMASAEWRANGMKSLSRDDDDDGRVTSPRARAR